MRSFVFVVAILILGSALIACGEGGDDTAAAAPAPGAPSPPPPNSPTNHAPTISGSPATVAMQGATYTFTPAATDGDGDVLTFSITGRPSWATFTTSNGRLSGTPGAGDVGMYSNIKISVTDGQASTPLATFAVNVVATATGSATLSWTPPTQNSDGSALTNLAGYRIYWGTAQGNYPNSVTVNNPGLATYVVDQLTPAKWFFVTTAVNAQGVESPYSNVASKTVM